MGHAEAWRRHAPEGTAYSKGGCCGPVSRWGDQKKFLVGLRSVRYASCNFEDANGDDGENSEEVLKQGLYGTQ